MNKNPKEIEQQKCTFFNSNIYLKENSNELISFNSFVKRKIDDIEKSPSITRNVFKLYSSIEQDLIREIPKDKYRKLYKEALNELLYSHFFKKDTESRVKRAKLINVHYSQFLSSIDFRRNYQEDFHLELTYNPYEKSDLQTKSLRKILKEMENCLFDECMLYIMTKCFTDYVPLFLINKKLIKQKVSLIWKLQYEIPIDAIKMKSQYGYNYLSQVIINFSLKNIQLFDLTIFSKSLLGKVFKCFFLSNMSFLLSNERNFNIFQQQLAKYLRIMSINQPDEIVIIKNYVKGKYLESKRVGVDYRIFQEAKETFEELTKMILNDFRILITEKGDEKMLFIIFSFSLMLNSLIKLNWDKDQISFSKELQCSACERQLLLNFLHTIEIFISLSNNCHEAPLLSSVLNVNHYLESSIFSPVIKAKASDLFDVSMRYKTDISYETMIDNMKTNRRGNINQTILEQEDQEAGFFDEYFNIFQRELNLNRKDQINYSLIPHDRDNISTHICICIDDHYDSVLMNQLSNKNLLVDFYCFNWRTNKSENGIKSFFKKIFSNEEEEMEGKAMFAGKFLAYVLGSRALFKFHTFSLIGISNGANVIKYCINELKKLSLGLEYCNDLVNDIMFVNGQTDFNLIDLSALNAVVTGRIINVHSNRENEGDKEIIGSSEVIYNRIENYDISTLMFLKEEYKINLDYILGKVKLFR